MNSVQSRREEHNQTEIKRTEYSVLSISLTQAVRKNIVSYNQSGETKPTASCCVSSRLVTGLTVAGRRFINCWAVDGVVLGRRRWDASGRAIREQNGTSSPKDAAWWVNRAINQMPQQQLAVLLWIWNRSCGRVSRDSVFLCIYRYTRMYKHLHTNSDQTMKSFLFEHFCASGFVLQNKFKITSKSLKVLLRESQKMNVFESRKACSPCF